MSFFEKNMDNSEEDEDILKKKKVNISPFSYEHPDRLILETAGRNYVSPYVTCILMNISIFF